MKRALYLSIGLLSAVFVTYMTLPLFASDFDKFAKATIRELGHRSDPKLATDAVLQYLDENKIDDPIAFFAKNMDTTYVINADDPNLSETDRAWVRSGKVKRLTSFSSKYFNRVLTSYDLAVHIRDFRSGERTIHARIYLNAP
ncbi:MAG: hypothetical protein AAGF25_11140 [Pseudomonadota bacterium]